MRVDKAVAEVKGGGAGVITIPNYDQHPGPSNCKCLILFWVQSSVCTIVGLTSGLSRDFKLCPSHSASKIFSYSQNEPLSK